MSPKKIYGSKLLASIIYPKTLDKNKKILEFPPRAGKENSDFF